MGNQFNKHLEENSQQFDVVLTNQHALNDIDLNNLGELPAPVRQNLEKLKPFEENMKQITGEFLQVPDKPGQFYRGAKNEDGQPHGFGQKVFSDGSTYLGYFKNGKGEPKGVYLFADGGYYTGQVKDNKAQGKGQFIKQKFIYEGNFHNNKFDGEGIIKVGNRYEFDGTLSEGKKVKGRLLWYQDDDDKMKSIYEGSFDEAEEFTGEGVLRNNFGTYKGNFQHGLKDGAGVFQNTNGLQYVGKYVNGIRHGFGTIYNYVPNSDQQIRYEVKDELIAYQGNFFKGLPNGKGKVYDPKLKKLVQTEWQDGLNKKKLQAAKPILQ